MSDFPTPTIHLNGTSATMLRDDFENTNDKFRDFVDAWEKMEFHPRDYYVQGDDAFSQAQAKRREMTQKIREVNEYLQTYGGSLYK